MARSHVPTSIRLDRGQLDRVRVLSGQLGMPMAAFIRAAIDDKIDWAETELAASRLGHALLYDDAGQAKEIPPDIRAEMRRRIWDG